MIKVKDNGVGIPAAQLPHIFDRFFQVDDSHTRKGEGTGIGLALTSELVILLGGTIDVRSEEGEDTLLSKVREQIEIHLDEEDFGIIPLCRELGVSRTQLRRKLKALTNKSTSQVIRTIRMRKARELLEKTNLNVSDVGYAVGYGNRSYSTQEFTREFGQAPSFFRGEG